MGNGDVDADKYMEKMLPTKAGRRLFPSTSALIGVSEHLLELGRNCATLLKETGKHMKQALGFFLVGGLPTSFIAETLNSTKRGISHFHKQPVQAAMTSLFWNYAPNPESISFTEDEETVMEDFFFGRHP